MSPPLPTRAGLPPAGLGRRLQAFVLDRLVLWGLLAGAWWPLVGARAAGDAAGIALSALALTVCAEVALAVPLGLRGITPGSAARGVRLVDPATARPVGLVPSLARAGILVVALLPTAGLGAAALGWTAVTDPGRRRRGWHDRWTGAVVVDARRAPWPSVPEEERPAGLVNLTALRLAPGPAAPGDG